MRYYVIDAFTDTLFRGNPAGVCLPDAPLSEDLMQFVAAENNLSETAFVVPSGEEYDIRWFTPTAEIDLCGHATLASAFALHCFVVPDKTEFRFHSKSGLLTVNAAEDGLYVMDFPSRPPEPIAVTAQMAMALGCPVLEARQSRDMLLLVANEAQLQALQPDIHALGELCGSIIVTAKGDSADFVSRFFAPEFGIMEDPVTGSAHSTLIPFWAARLGKQRLFARQLSRRGGSLYCENLGERVSIAGRATLYLEGEINL